MKLSKEYLEKFKNMNLEEFKKFMKRDDITEEQMKKVKEELIKETNLYNDLQDLINKYGIEKTPQMLEILIDEMKIYLGLMNEFKNINSNFYNYPDVGFMNSMMCNIGDNNG